MAWNEPDEKKFDLDPWGRKINNLNKNNSIIFKKKNLIKFLFGKIVHFKIKKYNNKINHPIFLGIIFTFIIWVISGFYTIKEFEQGVVTHFGKFSHLVKPGLHWKPTFINQIKTVNVQTVRELKSFGNIFTRDKNIIEVEINVQYKVIFPEQYLFSVNNSDEFLKHITDSSIQNVIGQFSTKKLLNEKYRFLVRKNIEYEIKKSIYLYKIGIKILDINFESVRLPKAIQTDFNNITIIYKKCKENVYKARQIAKKTLLKTYFQAEKILKDARIYKSRMMLEAQSEIFQFYKLLPIYRLSKKLIVQRLYIESMKKIFKNANKILLNNQIGDKLFLLDKSVFLNKNSLIQKIQDDKKNIKLNFSLDSVHRSNLKKRNNKMFSLKTNNSIVNQRRLNALRNNTKY